MHVYSKVVGVLVLLVVSCSPNKRTMTQVEPTRTQQTTIENSPSEGCHGIGPIFGVELERAKSLVPEPFTPLDAEGFAKIPAGHAAGVIWVMTCEKGPDFAQLLLTIEPPDAQLTEVEIELYELVRFVADDAEVTRLRGLGYRVSPAELSFVYGTDESGKTVTARASIVADGSPVFELTARANSERVDIPRVRQRIWHALDDRLVYTEVTFPPHSTWLGVATNSMLQEDSIVQELAGGKRFEHDQSAIVEILDVADFSSRFIAQPKH